MKLDVRFEMAFMHGFYQKRLKWVYFHKNDIFSARIGLISVSQIKGFNLEAGHHFLALDVLMDHPKPSV